MDLNEIGCLIRNQRLSKNLSQAAVSKVVRISRPKLSQLETGNLPEIGIRKVIEVLEQLGLELTVREAHSRPTLRELTTEQTKYITSLEEVPTRKRAKRRSLASAIETKEQS
jgi:HTH-type transcriptional regulator/antitoxin HipB